MRSAVSLGDTPELYRMTRNVVVVFNGIVDAFLSLIDTIRSFPPTTRRPKRAHLGTVPRRASTRLDGAHGDDAG